MPRNNTRGRHVQVQFAFRGDAPWLGLAKMPSGGAASAAEQKSDVLVGFSQTCHMFATKSTPGPAAGPGDPAAAPME